MDLRLPSSDETTFRTAQCLVRTAQCLFDKQISHCVDFPGAGVQSGDRADFEPWDIVYIVRRPLTPFVCFLLALLTASEGRSRFFFRFYFRVRRTRRWADEEKWTSNVNYATDYDDGEPRQAGKIERKRFLKWSVGVRRHGIFSKVFFGGWEYILKASRIDLSRFQMVFLTWRRAHGAMCSEKLFILRSLF